MWVISMQVIFGLVRMVSPTLPLLRTRSCSQVFQQRLGLLEVGGIKPLGKPTVDRGEQVIGCSPLALVLPEAAQARGGAQLEGFGLLAASDVAFRKAHELDSRFALPYRVPAARFAALIEESRSALSAGVRHRLAPTLIRTQAMPTPEQVRQGVDPDALSLRGPGPQDVLTLFQVNHENRSPSEEALQTLVSRSLAAV